MQEFNLKIDELAKAFNVSRSTVIKRIDYLIYGVHYFDIARAGAKNRQLRFNLKACQDYFLTAPEKR
jgi:transcriptional antiterminator